MRVRPRQNGSWLFPVMVVAAACVVAFGALGLAVVTGHMRGKQPAPGSGDGLVTAEAGSPLNGTSAAVKQDGAGRLSVGIGQN